VSDTDPIPIQGCFAGPCLGPLQATSSVKDFNLSGELRTGSPQGQPTVNPGGSLNAQGYAAATWNSGTGEPPFQGGNLLVTILDVVISELQARSRCVCPTEDWGGIRSLEVSRDQYNFDTADSLPLFEWHSGNWQVSSCSFEGL
jgi:hypothetical protein